MRKTKLVTISTEGRDKGKCFLITEMPAMQAEKWAAKALLALSRSGVEVGDDVIQAGAAAVLSAGLGAFRTMAFADAEPLLDEMMQCISFVPDRAKADPATGNPLSRPLFPEDDIEEVATLLALRGEVVEVHTGFSVAAALSRAAAATLGNSSRAPTSRPASRSSSGKARRRSPSVKASTA